MTPEEIVILSAIHAVTEATGRRQCKCNRVIEVAAKNTGVYGDSLAEALWNESRWNHPVLMRIYRQIIALVHDNRWVAGQGNMGTRITPRAHPKVTECWLTEAGRSALFEHRSQLDHRTDTMTEPISDENA